MNAIAQPTEPTREAPRNGAKSEGEPPVRSYRTLILVFSGGLGGLLMLLASERALPKRVPPEDLALLGIATHKMTRILTRDRVTIPIRAPFTEYDGSAGASEVHQHSRGQGLRRAIGDLISCPFCTGPWVGTALAGAFALRPRMTRLVALIFASAAISDFLHQAYAGVRKLSK